MIKYKKFIVGLIIIFVAPMLFWFFPLLGFWSGWHGTRLSGIIITSVFISIWLLILLAAIKLKSSVLMYIFICYWLVVTIAHFFAIIGIGASANLDGLWFLLIFVFIFPLIGIHQFASVLGVIVSLFFTLCLCAIGYFFKNKAFSAM
ncbi:MAG: hypothetical protein FWB91_12630 [Defluviitaleaceae bacterium]|nr:hypothetical protein [Defluviitaleaceae bacterium]